jgi:hypothetical protein
MVFTKTAPPDARLRVAARRVLNETGCGPMHPGARPVASVIRPSAMLIATTGTGGITAPPSASSVCLDRQGVLEPL